jgi:hypothetical protein
MRLDTELARVQCPYCGEAFDIVVDPSEPVQHYIEDCFVCCRPIDLQVHVDAEGAIEVIARSENE